MMRWFLYIATAILSFALFVIVFAPAATIWSLAKDDIGPRLPPDLQVLTIDGTVWSGDATIRYREFPPSALSWSLDPFALIDRQVVADIVVSGVEGDDHSIASDLVASRRHLEIAAGGYIDSAYINRVSAPYGLVFSGRLDVTRLTAQSDYAWFTAAEGDLHWDGGTILYRTYEGTQSLELPPLDGTLTMAGRDIHLDIDHAGDPVIAITLRPAGWAVVDLKRRLFDLAGIDWPGGATADMSVLMLEEKIF